MMWPLRTFELVLLYGAGVVLGVHIVLLSSLFDPGRVLSREVASPPATLVSAVVLLVTTFAILRTAKRRAKASAG